MDHLEVIMTADGSHTLRNIHLDETYHSVHGAIQESMHVFIKSGLHYYHQTRKPQEISVLEIGFGTGLNALLAMQYSRVNNIRIHYTTLEPFPLPREVWSTLNYSDDQGDFTRIHTAQWGEPLGLCPEFTLEKQAVSLQESRLANSADVIFFDAFAPSVQPELWGIECLKKVTDLLVPPGLLVTYSAKGQLKRDLKALGLRVETLPGPPGKLQMVRAQR